MDLGLHKVCNSLGIILLNLPGLQLKAPTTTWWVQLLHEAPGRHYKGQGQTLYSMPFC